MTPADLTELRRLLAAATPGPWVTGRTQDPMVHNDWFDAHGADPASPIEGHGGPGALGTAIGVAARPENAALIAALRNHAEELIAAAKTLAAYEKFHGIVERGGSVAAQLTAATQRADEFRRQAENAERLKDEADARWFTEGTAMAESLRAATQRADAAEAKLRALEAEARADKALIQRITRVCDECPEERHCDRCDGAGVVPFDPQAEAELEACVDGFPDDIDDSQLPHQQLAELVRKRDELSASKAATDAAIARAFSAARDVQATTIEGVVVELRGQREEARAVLRRIADGDAGHQGAFDWPEFYESIRNEARAALAGKGGG